MLLHTTAPEVRTGEELLVTLRLVVCVEENEDMACAGTTGIAARTSAAMTARLKRRWESLIVFIRTILL